MGEPSAYQGGKPGPRNNARAPAAGPREQVIGHWAFVPQTLLLLVLVVWGCVLWAWLNAGGSIWAGTVLVVVLLAAYCATFAWTARLLNAGGVWIGAVDSEPRPLVVARRRGAVGSLGVVSSDGTVRSVPGSLHRPARIIKTRGRLATAGVTRSQHVTWEPAAEPVADLARRIRGAHTAHGVPETTDRLQ